MIRQSKRLVCHSEERGISATIIRIVCQSLWSYLRGFLLRRNDKKAGNTKLYKVIKHINETQFNQLEIKIEEFQRMTMGFQNGLK